MRILLSSSDWKAASTCLTSFGKMGHEVHIVSDEAFDPILFSKYCCGRVLGPSESNRDGYLAFLLGHLKENKYDLFIPISDQCCENCLLAREEINRYTKMHLPSDKALDLAHDKVKTYRFAEEHGIRIPKTYYPQTVQEVEDISKRVVYPCVVKFAKSTGGSGVKYARAPEDLSRISTQRGDLGWPVIQEFIAGVLVGFTAICCKGKILVHFSFIATRQYPASGGVTVYARSIFDQELYEDAKGLIEKLGWDGVIDLDYLLTPEGDRFFLEINPRMSGTTQFAYNCGVDFPRVYFDMLIHGKEEAVSVDYKSGRKYRSLFPEEIRSCIEDKRNIWAFFFNFLDPRYSYDIDFRDFGLLLAHLKDARWEIQKRCGVMKRA